MAQVMEVRRAGAPAPPRLVLRWEASPAGLVGRWELSTAPWFAPAAARPLRRAPTPAAPRLARYLAARALARRAA